MLHLPDEQVTLGTPVPVGTVTWQAGPRHFEGVLGKQGCYQGALFCFWVVTLFSQAPRIIYIHLPWDPV